jgi:glycosyltransferase involved in cell wall biosynthesis
MRIVLIGLHFAEIAARLGLALSKDNDVQIHVARRAADREWTPTLRAQLEAAVGIVYLPHPHRARLLWHGFRLARAVARFAPDVVHVQEAAGWTISAFLMCLGRKAPAFVLTVHDPKPHSGDARARARTRAADGWVRRRADAVIVHGEALVRDMEAMAPGLRGRIFCVPHGALGEGLGASPPPGQGRFLMFGRLQAYKGLGPLLDAVEILTAQNRSFKVLIAGAGDDLEAHGARIAGLAAVRLDERYIPAAEVGALFESCDAVVTPYLDATQSGVGALAMAAGRAVIATDVGALCEIVRDGENGLIVPAGDALRLAEAMARILDEPGLAAQLGRRARETAEGRLNWGAIAERTVWVYQSAREARRR